MIDPKLLRSAPDDVAAQSCATGLRAGCGQPCRRSRNDARPRRSPRPTGCARARMHTAKKVGMAKGKGEDVTPLLAEGEKLAQAAWTDWKAAINAGAQAELDELQLNATQPAAGGSCRTARDETANVELRRWGTPRSFDFAPRDHVASWARPWMRDGFRGSCAHCGRALRGAQDAVARLHRALVQFMLDLHTREHGYTEVYVPYWRRPPVRRRHRPAAQVRGRPVAECAREQEYFLIPTAEVPCTNLVREQILEARDAAAEATWRIRPASAPRRARPARTRAA